MANYEITLTDVLGQHKEKVTIKAVNDHMARREAIILAVSKMKIIVKVKALA